MIIVLNFHFLSFPFPDFRYNYTLNNAKMCNFPNVSVYIEIQYTYTLD
jgi:hypothetical protein